MSNFPRVSVRAKAQTPVYRPLHPALTFLPHYLPELLICCRNCTRGAGKFTARYKIDPAGLSGESYVAALAARMYSDDGERAGHRLLKDFRFEGAPPVCCCRGCNRHLGAVVPLTLGRLGEESSHDAFQYSSMSLFQWWW